MIDQLVRRGPTVAFVVLLLAAGAGCDDDDAIAAGPIIPEDWETSLVEIRDCRLGVEHGLEFVKLYVDAASEEHFETCTVDPEACEEPFPQGALFVKPQYADEECTELERISATVREETVSEPGEQGWRWQELDSDLEVVTDGQPSSCVNCHDRCTGFDTRCAMDP